MEFGFILTLLMIGFLGSFLSGMLGIGGAIINFPLLLYIPVMVGFQSFSSHEVTGIVVIQVFCSTLGGVWAHRKSGKIKKELVITMGSSIVLGSIIGGYGSSYLSEEVINLIYGIVVFLATFLMFVPKNEEGEEWNGEFNKKIGAVISFLIGMISGVIGAGGSFILVPVMFVLFKIPLRITIATSLVIAFISSIGGAASKMATGQVPFMAAVIVAFISLIGSPIGAYVSQRINTKVLHGMLAVIITLTTIKVWFAIIL